MALIHGLVWLLAWLLEFSTSINIHTTGNWSTGWVYVSATCLEEGELLWSNFLAISSL